MATVADDLWALLVKAGVRRCYGIVGDALNPIMNALRANGQVEFIHVRNEEYGALAASGEAYLTGEPVVVCGTAGPGATHLLNGLIDALHERVPVIAIVGDVESAIIDTYAIEEISPYDLFRTGSLYTARLVSPHQLPTVLSTVLSTAISRQGPVVLSIPGDVAAAKSVERRLGWTRPSQEATVPTEDVLGAVADVINNAEKVAIFAGAGCRGAEAELKAVADALKAPVGFSFRGKQWVEHATDNSVGMTGLIGWGSCYAALHEADVLLMLGTNFPFSTFLPDKNVVIVQVDSDATSLGRRTPVDFPLHGDVKATLQALVPRLQAKTNDHFLTKHLEATEHEVRRMNHYVVDGTTRLPIRPEYLVSVLDRLASDSAIFSIDTGTACIWAARYLRTSPERRILASYSWASMATASPKAFGAALSYPGRQTIALCGDGGFSMLGIGDLMTQVQHKTPVVNIILNNSMLDFVNIEQQEAGIVPFGTDLANPDYSKVAEAFGAKGIRISRPEDVESGLTEALNYTDGPVVVDVLVDKNALALPQHVPLQTAEGFTLSAAKQALSGHVGIFQEALDNIRLL